MSAISVPSLGERLFYDQFVGGDGLPGNGWTRWGTGSNVASGVYTVTTATNNLCYGITRDTGISSGRQRIQGRVITPNATLVCHLTLCSNASGNQGLVCSVSAAGITLQYWTGTALGGTNIPATGSFGSLTSATIRSGDLITLNLWDSVLGVQVNGLILNMQRIDHNAIGIPATNSWAGPRVQRTTVNSGGWDDVAIMQARPL